MESLAEIENNGNTILGTETIESEILISRVAIDKWRNNREPLIDILCLIYYQELKNVTTICELTLRKAKIKERG